MYAHKFFYKIETTKLSEFPVRLIYLKKIFLQVKMNKTQNSPCISSVTKK